jgi:hypothetical protein
LAAVKGPHSSFGTAQSTLVEKGSIVDSVHIQCSPDLMYRAIINEEA